MIRRCRRGTAVATSCAIGVLGALALAPAAMAGKPTPAPPPPPSTTATAYSGEAQVVEADIGIFSPSLLRVQASITRSSALAKCSATGAELSGRSDLLNLKIAVGEHLFAQVLVTSAPNQGINKAGFAKITINEQIVTANAIDVTALRIELNPDEGLGTLLSPTSTATSGSRGRMRTSRARAGRTRRRHRRARSRTGSPAAARSAPRMRRSA